MLSISRFRHPGLTKAVHVHGYNVRRKMPNPCLPFRDCGIGVKLDHPGDRFARLLDKSKLLRGAFGDGVIDHYVHTAKWEQFEYDRRITDWELRRGFEQA